MKEYLHGELAYGNLKHLTWPEVSLNACSQCVTSVSDILGLLLYDLGLSW